MGSPINYPDDLSWTWNMGNLTKEQRHNRIFLTELMTSNDFANFLTDQIVGIMLLKFKQPKLIPKLLSGLY
jgi:hypothetical protein